MNICIYVLKYNEVINLKLQVHAEHLNERLLI